MVIMYWLSHTGQGPLGDYWGESLQQKTHKGILTRPKTKFGFGPRKNGMILATFSSLMPMLTLIALNTILSLGIAGKIRSMKTMGQGSGYLVKPAPVFNLGIKYLKKILPEKLERVEQKSFQSQVWLSFLSHLLMETRSFCPTCLESLWLHFMPDPCLGYPWSFFLS